MDGSLLDVTLADPLWIVVALAAGLLAQWVGLPPLVGYLVAGFGLHALGAEAGEFMDQMADLGILLLLYGIGLKLDVRLFARSLVWIVGFSQLVLLTALLSGVALLLIVLGVGPLAGLERSDAVLLGFTLSFSSTVFAVKTLDDRGAGNSRHGRLSIGILILQDVFAVVFLVASSGKIPSLWALVLIPGLILVRPILNKLLDLAGHRELLMLFAVGCALGGAALFEAVGLKGDLGALTIGILLTTNTKSGELNRSMLALKDLFLVAFFLSIGIDALPTPGGLLAGLLLLLALPLKPLVYSWLLTRAKVRARTSWQVGLNLASYSEFGLVVLLEASSAGLVPEELLSTMAALVAVSFVIAAPVAERGEDLYERVRGVFKRLERPERLPGDEDLKLHDIDVVVFGMGRMGARAYDAMEKKFPGRVLGVDADEAIVERNQAKGRSVVAGDATDSGFWTRAGGLVATLHWVLLTMPDYSANRSAISQARARGFTGSIAATSPYPDEVRKLERAGVDFAFDIVAEAGAGFAGDLLDRVGPPGETEPKGP